MILGSFSFSQEIFFSLIDSIRESLVSEGLVFHPVSHKGFTGGFFLNSRLPLIATDFYYYDDASDILVLVSGCIYNRKELLHLSGTTKSIPDPELIAQMFLREGPGFVKRCNGDFAIFLCQPLKGNAYLFRDHVGICPLAWLINNKSLLFASDLTGLCRAVSDGKAIDSDYMLSYFKYSDYRKTPDERVKKLPPGHFLCFSENRTVINRYWSPERLKIDRRMSYYQMLTDLKSILLDAVRIRCDNRFTAGAHTSSGLDSGIVATLARKEYLQQKIFYGFSWSPAEYKARDVKFDEREIIIKSCEKTGISPVFTDLDKAKFLQLVSYYFRNQGYFSEDRTVEQAVNSGTNLIFSGWGGDDFISTGNRGIDTDLLVGLKWKTFFRRNCITSPVKFARTMLYSIVMPALGILDRTTIKSLHDVARYIKKPYNRNDKKALRNYFFHKSRHQMHLRLLQFYHLQERCESWAINGYCNGVIYRYPLLDRRIIEFMLKVPSELLCATEHYRPLLRILGEEILPDEVRLHQEKIDPVCWEFMKELYKETAVTVMEEVNGWKNNPDLHFFDFDRLAEDIHIFKSHPERFDNSEFFWVVVYLKGLHEFTLEYRNRRTILGKTL